MKRELSAFVRNDRGVYVMPGYEAAFAYSDGESQERYVLETLRGASDLGLFSPELGAKIRDWSSEYHFSPKRHNLLRHLALGPQTRILELGCGCGALTRQLGESGARVTAVEGSPQRAGAAAARCRDLPGVRVYCADFQDVAFGPEYDLVTLIGVLEYSRLYFRGDDAVRECLGVAQGALRPEGALLVAMENQLGLKYFCGLREDHVDIAYFGIEDRYGADTAVTFGRRELAALLRDAGFAEVVFHYPFPDYKIPTAVFTEAAFGHAGFMPEEILRRLRSRDYCGELTPAFDERLAVPALCRNGLMQDMANSFLVLAGRAPGATARLFDPETLAVVYTTERAAPYNVRTVFSAEGAGIRVDKRRLAAEARAPVAGGNPLDHHPGPEVYVAGRNLEALYERCVLTRDFAALWNLLERQIAFLKREAVETPDPADAASRTIRPDMFDCTPANLILKDGRLALIDREWTLTRPVSLGVLALRTVDALHALGPDLPELDRNALLARFAAGGVVIDERHAGQYARLIRDVLAQVYRGTEHAPAGEPTGPA